MVSLRRVFSQAAGAVARAPFIESIGVPIAGVLGRVFDPRKKPQSESPFDIDAVYLWVDATDPTWLRRKAKFEKSKVSPGSNSASRFRQFGELQTSIKLLGKNAPFIRKVFIVTDYQKPDLSMLGELPFEVEVVFHDSFIDEKFLPTYSSRALAANLHRIPGLAERFLYLNDDTFVAAPATPQTWFTQEGVRLRYSKTAMPPKSRLATSEAVYNARWATVELAATKGWLENPGQMEHGAHPMMKSVMQELWKTFPEELEQTTSARFRTPNGILPEWLHNLAALATGRAELVSDSSYKYIAMNDVTSAGGIIQVLLRRGRILNLCLNDVAELNDRKRLEGERLAKRYRRLLSRLL